LNTTGYVVGTILFAASTDVEQLKGTSCKRNKPSSAGLNCPAFSEFQNQPLTDFGTQATFPPRFFLGNMRWGSFELT
jgi:hypothetical protein